MTTIIQYGLGNVGSIFNMCKYIGAKVRISSSLAEIEDSTSLILPGIGSFDNGMQLLEETGIKDILQKKVIQQKVPILGICLGMQLMMQESEEGVLPGLSFIEGKCIKFKFEKDNNLLRIPHMGWNDVHPTNAQSLLFRLINNEMRFYFAHSYHVVCRPDDIIATTNYGYDFPAAIQHNNVTGVQFHPEKSHQFGMNLLKAFTALKLS